MPNSLRSCASSSRHPKRLASSMTWRGLASTLTSTPGSPRAMPCIRNCVARVVFPVPIWPRTRMDRFAGNPPSIMASSPTTPLVTRLVMSLTRCPSISTSRAGGREHSPCRPRLEPLVEADSDVGPVAVRPYFEGRPLVAAPKGQGELAPREQDLGQRAHLRRIDVVVALQDPLRAQIPGGGALPVAVRDLALHPEPAPQVLVHR